jgi:hypothetical protein
MTTVGISFQMKWRRDPRALLRIMMREVPVPWSAATGKFSWLGAECSIVSLEIEVKSPPRKS